MDPTSHSVYLAGGTWSGFTGFSPNVNGDGCTGDNMGPLPGACSDLDTPAGRIQLRVHVAGVAHYLQRYKAGVPARR